MKLTIPALLMVLALTTAVGCGQDTETATILAPSGSTGSKTAPAAADKGTDETVAPKSEMPPETPKAPKEGDKSAEAAPETPVILYVAPSAPIFIPLAPVAPKQVMALTDLHSVTCEHCSGPGGAEYEFRCPSNYVVTGFRFGEDAFDVTPDTGIGEGSIESSTAVVGGLKILCSRLDQDHVRGDDVALASYKVTDSETGELSDVTYAGKNYELDSAVNCPIADGVATGVIGRSGGRLDSFGLTCGLYLHNDTFTGVFPAAKETPTGDESVYGGMPGNGGASFDASCDVNEVIVGLSIAGGDQVDGIRSLTCAKVALVDALN